MRTLLLISFLLIPCLLAAQEKSAPVEWTAIEYFVGAWDGDESGRAGVGKGDREYFFIMDGKYLHAKNSSRFEPQEKNPKGETHEDWAFYSYDEIRGKVVLREFNIEGYVNQFVLDSLSEDGKTMIFLAEAMENVPEDWKARYTFKILNENEFDEIFELAMPGKEYSVFLENHWTRKK